MANYWKYEVCEDWASIENHLTDEEQIEFWFDIIRHLLSDRSQRVSFIIALEKWAMINVEQIEYGE